MKFPTLLATITRIVNVTDVRPIVGGKNQYISLRKAGTSFSQESSSSVACLANLVSHAPKQDRI